MIVLSEALFYQQFKKELVSRAVVLPARQEEAIGFYFYLLYCANKIMNLTGYEDVPDYIDFHLIDTIRLLDSIHPSQGTKMVDVGSGAGIPGLIIGILRSDMEILLIETIQKKVGFMQSVIKELSLKNCSVINQRAEDAAKDPKYRENSDLVVARALASFPVALELTAGFVRKEGMVALPRGNEEFISGDESCVYELGCRLLSKTNYSIPRRDRGFQIVCLKKIENLLPKYPRKPGQIQKRPL